ncbi:hypothetical protein BD626DRAFT_562913 [Schizophyllum amplum]|uniref:BZIP domain-containing protein n=1 Tax=Schizophyllum amplum TaxID=97359 RepID=A0A550CWF0_9AGAR|nr:hypothetical protein BD626DRAFT_562913 [Auriculariopsis ampla]
MDDEPTPLSQIIRADAMLSPLEAAAAWDIFPPSQDPFPCSYGQPSPQHPNFFQYPPSSPSSFSASTTDSPGGSTSSGVRMLRLSPDTSDSEQQLCMPTSQLFEFPQQASIPPAAPSPTSPADEGRYQEVTLKRSASPDSIPPQSAIQTKKRTGERVTTKDFVPPDVSGLSKREARLVKNRAAAFLSRQRKREEFELMEVRVAELERENARLLSLTQSGSDKLVPGGVQPADAALLTEVERLRARLADAEARERNAGAAFSNLSRHASHDVPVKMEPQDIAFNSQTARSSAMQSPLATGVGLGLMVLLCALPALLRTYGAASAMPPSHIDLNTILTPELNWHRQGDGVVLDLDVDDQGRPRSLAANPALAAIRRLELSGTNASAIVGLGGRELAFAATSSESGRIRVRVCPPSARSESPKAFPSPRSSSASDGSSIAASSLSSAWLPSLESLSMPAAFSAGMPDPFFGMGQGDYGMSYPMMCATELGPTVYSPTESSFASALGHDFAMAAVEDPARHQMQIALKAASDSDWTAQFC